MDKIKTIITIKYVKIILICYRIIKLSHNLLETIVMIINSIHNKIMINRIL
jgi:hypothetical protein